MEDMKTSKIISAAIEVHRTLGPGMLEKIYETALCHEFQLRNIKYMRQKSINIRYKDLVIKGQRLDLVVENDIVVEIKSLMKLPEIVIAQVISYLRATGLITGLIINFGQKTLSNGIKRVSL